MTERKPHLCVDSWEPLWPYPMENVKWLWNWQVPGNSSSLRRGQTSLPSSFCTSHSFPQKMLFWFCSWENAVSGNLSNNSIRAKILIIATHTKNPISFFPVFLLLKLRFCTSLVVCGDGFRDTWSHKINMALISLWCTFCWTICWKKHYLVYLDILWSIIWNLNFWMGV